MQQELKTLRTAKELGFYTFGLAYDEEIAMQIAADNHDALVLGLAMLEWENGGATLEQAAEYIDRREHQGQGRSARNANLRAGSARTDA